VAKSKEQKQHEAIERNRRDLHEHREMFLRYSPGTPLYKELVQVEGQKETDKLFWQYDRRLTMAAQAAHCDRHGNPIDLSWRRIEHELVVVRINDSPAAWKMVVVDSREKQFIRHAGSDFFDIEYASHYEFDCARRRMGEKIHGIEYKIIWRNGANEEF
jgi:hypothetical protein